jgi:sulfur carrier protein
MPGEKATSIQLNGEAFVMNEPASVAALIDRRAPRPPFAVEVNRTLVRRSDFATTALRDGDVVEIVTLVGGG